MWKEGGASIDPVKRAIPARARLFSVKSKKSWLSTCLIFWWKILGPVYAWRSYYPRRLHCVCFCGLNRPMQSDQNTKQTPQKPALSLLFIFIVWLSFFLLRLGGPPDLRAYDQERPARWILQTGILFLNPFFPLECFKRPGVLEDMAETVAGSAKTDCRTSCLLLFFLRTCRAVAGVPPQGWSYFSASSCSRSGSRKRGRTAFSFSHCQIVFFSYGIFCGNCHYSNGGLLLPHQRPCLSCSRNMPSERCCRAAWCYT